MNKKKKYAANAKLSAFRDPLPHGAGVSLYSSPNQAASAYRTRPYPLESERQGHRANGSISPSPSSWEAAVSPAFDDLEESLGYETPPTRAEHKRREMGWTSSFPAEYHRAHQTHDYQQTLAYQEQLNQRKRNQQQLTNAVVSGSTLPIKSTVSQKASFPNAPSPNRQELELLKQVTMREGILERLKGLVQSAAAGGFQADTGNELLQLLLQLRDASVTVMCAMSQWHQSTASRASRPPAYIFKGRNYCGKMVSDLNFLAGFSSLGRVLGVDPSRMKQNPFMMPSPIPDREFIDVQGFSASSPPRFSFSDPVERVAEAEKYLVWSLVNLPEGMGNIGTTNNPETAPPTQLPPQQPQLTTQGKRELLTWQERAEQQLRLLSMPLESPTGQARLMDSSRMMKRKGYLPSLPQSPPKTLTELMENVHKGGYTSPTKNNCFSSLEISHDGIAYRMTALDIEVLGSNEAPPHAIVTLVTASVLILLSPSDRIPKDLAWPSCQKMLANGVKLIQRIEDVNMDAIPAFKWKALLPFLQNEHYDPMFLMEYSSAAATLCAWVLHVLERAQQNDRAAKGDEDRQELLEELEQDEHDLPPMTPDVLRPVSRNSRGSKRVSIGSAEVLFINENEPVSPPPSASGSSRPPSSCVNTHAPRRHVLLRTSPWTHRGVTYFVSFFLEKSDDAPHELLSVKMYEPMSSVESQMFVSPDDLLLDFGASAHEFFQRREFGHLCDLILTRLDAMMSPPSRDGLAASRHDPAVTECPQSHPDDAALRIQCAVRQRHARNRVHHVRFAKQQQETSAIKIQSLARQQQARKRVAHLKLMQRTPTGLPPRDLVPEEVDDEDEAEDTPEPADRPPTTASEASELFDDDFEAE